MTQTYLFSNRLTKCQRYRVKSVKTRLKIFTKTKQKLSLDLVCV